MWKLIVFQHVTLAILLLAHSKGVQCVISEEDSQQSAETKKGKGGVWDCIVCVCVGGGGGGGGGTRCFI